MRVGPVVNTGLRLIQLVQIDSCDFCAMYQVNIFLDCPSFSSAVEGVDVQVV